MNELSVFDAILFLSAGGMASFFLNYAIELIIEGRPRPVTSSWSEHEKSRSESGCARPGEKDQSNGRSE